MCVLLTCGDRVLQSQISTLLAVTRCFLNAQSTFSSGLATGRYNRTDAARQRLQAQWMALAAEFQGALDQIEQRGGRCLQV